MMIARLFTVTAATAAAFVPTSAQAAPARCVGYPQSRPVAAVCTLTADCYVAVGGTIFADTYCVPR